MIKPVERPPDWAMLRVIDSNEEQSLQVRIDFPFCAQFEIREIGSNSRELRTQALQDYLRDSGMELGAPIEAFQVAQFRGDDNGEFWTITIQR